MSQLLGNKPAQARELSPIFFYTRFRSHVIIHTNLLFLSFFLPFFNHRKTKSVTESVATSIRWRPPLDQPGHLPKVETNKAVLEFSVLPKSTLQEISHRTPLSNLGRFFPQFFCWFLFQSKLVFLLIEPTMHDSNLCACLSCYG